MEDERAEDEAIALDERVVNGGEEGGQLLVGQPLGRRFRAHNAAEGAECRRSSRSHAVDCRHRVDVRELRGGERRRLQVLGLEGGGRRRGRRRGERRARRCARDVAR